MFEVMDLSGRPLPELEEIARAFSVDSKGLAKNELVLKIVDAQAGNNDLAREVVEKFSKRPKEHKIHRDHKEKDHREKRPRKVKLEPIHDDHVNDNIRNPH